MLDGSLRVWGTWDVSGAACLRVVWGFRCFHFWPWGVEGVLCFS